MKLSAVIILLLAMLNLVPPLFNCGGIFDVHGTVIQCGEEVAICGVYFDNAYYIIVYMLLSFLGISLPFMVNMPKYLTTISNLLGGWFVAGLFYEVLNLWIPEEILNSTDNPNLFTRFALCFTVAMTFLMINHTWKRNNSTNS